jgi:hypothetical protein
MREKPIFFKPWKIKVIQEWDFEKQGPMQTRRVVKPFPGGIVFTTELSKKAPYQPGDHLWVWEVWCDGGREYEDDTPEAPCYQWIGYRLDNQSILYRVGDAKIIEVDILDDDEDIKWRSPIYMPKWASRLWLEVLDVKVERVQEISEGDAYREGVQQTWDIYYPPVEDICFRAGFYTTWNDIYKKKPEYQWDKNPWVWVYEFRKLKEMR